MVEKCSRRSSTRIMILLQPLNRRGVYDLPSPLLLRLKYRQQKRKGKDPRLQFYLNIRKRRFFRYSIAKDSSKLNCFPAQRERYTKEEEKKVSRKIKMELYQNSYFFLSSFLNVFVCRKIWQLRVVPFSLKVSQIKTLRYFNLYWS